MPVFRDRVKDTSTTTGTGALTLSGVAPTGYQTFANAFPTGTPFLYCVAGGAQWETGTGYLSAATTLIRDSVFESSSGMGVFVDFSAGDKEVFVTITSHWCEDTDSGANYAKARGYAMP
jgi:hypothetical protein